MRLNRVTKHDPKIRVSLPFHQSFLDKLDDYIELYKETYGDEISRTQMIEELCNRFMAADKDFQKHREKKNSGDTFVL